MNLEQTYNCHCVKCDEDTLHNPVQEKLMRVTLRTMRIIIFFISFGMACPHVFTEGDEVMVKCEKCGTRVVVSHE
jgi:hypothetical protein